MRPQSAQEQADEAIAEGALRNFRLPGEMKQSQSPPPESTSPQQSTPFDPVETAMAS